MKALPHILKSKPLAIGMIASGFALGSLAYLYSVPKVSIAEAAEKIVATCKESGGPMACYEAEVPKLYPDLSMGEMFDVIRDIRHRDPSYQFCHVLAHELGELAVAEDPDNWLDAIPLNPADGLCSNGFIHGVVGGKFRAEVLDGATIESLLPDFGRACEPRPNWSPSPLDQAICYHGMGHLYVFITDADLRAALDVCEETSDPKDPYSDYRRVCREGVFMQIYQPLEPDDFLMIERMAVKPSTTTVRQFCGAFRDRPDYEGACLRESWPFYREGIVDGTGVAAFCSGQPNAEEETSCYQSATAIIGRQSLGQADGAAEACAHLPTKRQALCFTTVARAVVEENRSDAAGAVAVCEKASTRVADECLGQLSTEAGFIFGGDRARAASFCAAFPEKYRARCGV